MGKVLINFTLSGELADRYLDVEKHILSRPGKPPARSDIIKALMGYDPWQLILGNERSYISGKSKHLGNKGDDVAAAGFMPYDAQPPVSTAKKGKQVR